MGSVRCPSCAHQFKTDRGVITHVYAGWTKEESRLAREAIDSLRREVPLPLMMDELPAGMLGYGLAGVLKFLADDAELP